MCVCERCSDLFRKRGFQDGQRLCDALDNLLCSVSASETEQHGLRNVTPPGGETSQNLL